MSKPPPPLPQGLRDRVFHRSEIRAFGLGASRAECSDLRPLGSGFYVPRESELTEVTMAVGVAAHYHGSIISGLTAARIYGMPLPPELGTWQPGQPVTLTAGSGTRRRSTAVVTWSFQSIDRDAAISWRGVLIASREDVWFQLCSVLPLDSRVAIADSLIRTPRFGYEGRSHAWSTIDALRQLVDRRTGSPGVRAARRALDLARVGADSPQETRARLAFGFAGVPEPALNQVIIHPSGYPRMQPDFMWEREKLIAEYDGITHFEGDRAARDQDRSLVLRDMGFAVISLYRDHLPPPRLAATDAEVERALGCSRAAELVAKRLRLLQRRTSVSLRAA